jgi:hypothetical protein
MRKERNLLLHWTRWLRSALLRTQPPGHPQRWLRQTQPPGHSLRWLSLSKPPMHSPAVELVETTGCTLPAFTLLELLTGMIVSSIVVAAAFSAFHIVGKQHSLYHERHESSSEASYFCSMLRRDFARAEVIEHSNGQLVCRTSQSSVNYKLLADAVLRSTTAHTDTFRVQVNRWQLGHTAVPGHLALEAELTVNGTPLPFQLIKTLSAGQQLAADSTQADFTHGD